MREFSSVVRTPEFVVLEESPATRTVCEADVVVWREDEAGVVHTDVAVFGAEVCDAIVGVLDAGYLPRSTDGCVRVGSVSHWF